MKLQLNFHAGLSAVLGLFFFNSGLSKLINPAWTSKGYLLGAKTFSGFYAWLASPEILPLVDAVNEWSLTLLGLSLLFGLGTRLSTKLGAVLMLLYYFPVLAFPNVGHGYLIDEHIIYASALLALGSYLKTHPLYFANLMRKSPLAKAYPRMISWLT
jgi:thiosulfate dehydrogenase [quinone] large subunit